VAEHCEELVLAAIGEPRALDGELELLPVLAYALVEPRVLERHRGLARDARGKPLVRSCEPADLGMAEQQAAEHLARPRDDGHGEIAAHHGMPPQRRAIRAVPGIVPHVIEAHDLARLESQGEQRRRVRGT